MRRLRQTLFALASHLYCQGKKSRAFVPLDSSAPGIFKSETRFSVAAPFMDTLNNKLSLIAAVHAVFSTVDASHRNTAFASASFVANRGMCRRNARRSLCSTGGNVPRRSQTCSYCKKRARPGTLQRSVSSDFVAALPNS